jgi:hypothetical protein
MCPYDGVKDFVNDFFGILREHTLTYGWILFPHLVFELV